MVGIEEEGVRESERNQESEKVKDGNKRVNVGNTWGEYRRR